MVQNTIIYIVCIGHSGSTLLGNILGAHSKILHIGELVSPIKKKLPIVCRDCQDKECPIWGKIITEGDLIKEFNNFSRIYNVKYKFFSSLFKSDAGKIYRKVFENLPQINFIIDSSKNLNWYLYQSKNKSYDHKFIFLKRRIDAVLASFKRNYSKTILEQIPNINKNITRLNNFFNKIEENTKCIIEYENFTINFQKEILKLMKFMNLDFEESMKEFNNLPHHLIGGNQANLIQKDRKKAEKLAMMLNYPEKLNDYEFYSFKGIKIDERWKDELTDFEKKHIQNDVLKFDF